MAVIVTPLHRYFSEARLVEVIDVMRDLGPPRIRAYLDRTTGAWLALEGTHRLRAALHLGLTPVMISVKWPRSARALERARFAAIDRGHVFRRVEIS